MTYDLAKQLKDAGWPDEGNDLERFTVGNWSAPFLSELIEACLDFPNQFSLYGRDKYRWEATSVGMQPYGAFLNKSVTEYGNTPEEAVAKLWLEIHKDDKR